MDLTRILEAKYIDQGFTLEEELPDDFLILYRNSKEISRFSQTKDTTTIDAINEAILEEMRKGG